MVVEEVDGGLSGDARRKGSDGGEDCSFRHDGPAVMVSVWASLPPSFLFSRTLLLVYPFGDWCLCRNVSSRETKERRKKQRLC